MTALMAPLLVGMVGVGVDVGVWTMEKRNLQTAADAAATAAAYEVGNNRNDSRNYAALKEAEANGYQNTSNNSLEISTGSDDQGRTTVTVTMRAKSASYFSPLVFSEDTYLYVEATAALYMDGNYCLLALDGSIDSAIETNGNKVEVDMPGCGMMVNSDSSSALDIGGGTITASEISIVGDYENKGVINAEINTNMSPMSDPFTDIDVPTFTPCSPNDMKNPTSYGSDTTLSPGVYCGGWKFTGDNIELEPGVYIIDGGGISASGGGTITGDNVTIILTNSSGDDSNWGEISVTGSTEVSLSAPNNGSTYDGVLIYQDREAPVSTDNNDCHKMTGSSSIILDGIVYAPNRCFEMGGSHDSSAPNNMPCTRLVAKRIRLHGNPSMANNCQDSAARNIGYTAVKLTL